MANGSAVKEDPVIATKKRVLVDVNITCEPPHYCRYGRRTMEDVARGYEEWVKDFEDFIRDHRSQDPVNLHVEREYEDHCSSCNSLWEPEQDHGDYGDGKKHCAACGVVCDDD